MNRKWMKNEGQKWVEDKIITSEQLDLIIARYPDNKGESKSNGILPVLASILIAIGILSFIASNWSEISPIARLALFIIIMIGFYTAGETFIKKGNETLGTSLNLLGIVSFGASIILLGQTFHLSAVDARLFAFWSLPAIFYLLRDRNKLYFFLVFVLTTGGQFYSMNEFQSFSLVLFLLFFISIGGYAFSYQSARETWVFSIGVSIHTLMFILVEDFHFLWFFLFGFALYTAAIWMKISTFKQPFKRIGTIIGFAFAYGLYFSLTNKFASAFELPNITFYLSVFVILLALSIYAQKNENIFLHFWELMIFVPYFYLLKLTDPLFIGVLYLIVMFLYAGFNLASGYRYESRSQINFGIVLFLLVCLMGYFNLAWSFMPKSIFFLIGGVLLFILNAFLQRKKKQILNNGGPHHE